MNWRNDLQTDVAKMELAAQQAWGPWVFDFDWSHWLTLTTETPWTPERLKKAFVDGFCRYATRAAQGPVPYLWAIEGGALGDQPHLHALLHGTAAISCARLVEVWPHGRAEVDVYDPRRGAAHYLTKEITGPVLGYDVSPRMPPLREAWCNAPVKQAISGGL